ncbi:ceramide glucosyltransferase-like [Acropora millepora]|uniref:ceramide glucosyltransferase-like n=1 Tax=Acropora millepora TaxID=45264 RepID=UPI001CF10632|nr:ceramide glucosyltransferase-like [Acropora millepora]
MHPTISNMASQFASVDDLYAPSAIDFLAMIFILLWILLAVFHLVSIVTGKIYLHNSTTATNNKEIPGVSILKPLVGEEPNLLKNLQTFFELNYPKFEILICLQDELDPAVKIVRQLMEAYPLVNSRLFTAAKTIGVNPKINNMNQGYKAAKYDLLWICDSNIKVHQGTLTELVSHMGPGVGMVHQIPFVTNCLDFAGCVDKVYFGTQHAFVYLLAYSLGQLCANGMSSLYSKPLLDEIGGLEVFSCYIAEDYFISKAIFKRGWKVVLSSDPAMQNPSYHSLLRYQQRMVRWTRLRLTMEPFPSVLEPLTESVVIGILASWAVSHLWAFSVAFSFIKHLLLWFFLDYLLLKTVQGPNNPLPPLWKLFLAWLFREFSWLAFFLQAACGREIEWRTSHFVLQLGGKAERLQEKCQDLGNHCC